MNITGSKLDQQGFHDGMRFGTITSLVMTFGLNEPSSDLTFDSTARWLMDHLCAVNRNKLLVLAGSKGGTNSNFLLVDLLVSNILRSK